jgi:lysophospholipase L1-like esterase
MRSLRELARKERHDVVVLRLLVVTALFAASFIVLGPRVSHARADSTWTAAWGSAMQEASPLSGNNFTCRTIERITLGGRQLRIHLSNRFVLTRTTFTRVTVAQRDRGGTLVHGTVHRVRFGGSASVTVAPGAEVTSDPVAMPVYADEDLAVSVYLRGAPRSFPDHGVGSTTQYCTSFGGAAGDHTADTGQRAFTERSTNVAWVSGVDVDGGPSAGAVIAIGDSITDGYRSTVDGFATWPDALSFRLMVAGIPLAVVNEGISGNRVLAAGGSGPPLVDRFDRDVLKQSHVRTVVVMEGTNDLGGGASAQHVIDGLTQIADAAHAAGLRIIGGTIPPRDSCCFNDEAAMNASLAEVNQFIRTDRHFDGVADFDAALRDPASPHRLNPAYDSGDHLHPNDAGYAAMARAVNLAELGGGRSVSSVYLDGAIQDPRPGQVAEQVAVVPVLEPLPT